MDKITKSIVEEFVKTCHGLGQIEINNNFPFLNAFLLSNINRSTQVLESFLALNEINTNNRLEHSIGILLRSALFDFIILSDYSNKSKFKDELDIDKFETKIKHQTLAQLKRLPEKHKENFEILKRSCQIAGNINELKGVTKLRPYAMSINDKYFICAIDIWEWYSKYEHYGLFTSDMTTQPDNIIRQNDSVLILMLNVFYSIITYKEFGVMGLDFEEFESQVKKLFKKYIKVSKQ